MSLRPLFLVAVVAVFTASTWDAVEPAPVDERFAREIVPDPAPLTLPRSAVAQN